MELIRLYNNDMKFDHELRMLEVSEPLIIGGDGADKIGIGSDEIWLGMIAELELQNRLESEITVSDVVSDVCN